MAKRTRYSAEFKAKVAKEAIKGEETLAQLAPGLECIPHRYPVGSNKPLMVCQIFFLEKPIHRKVMMLRLKNFMPR